MSRDYAALKELLETQETFPTNYMHKFTGKETPAFRDSVRAFEAKFPQLKKESERASSGGKYVAMTYFFYAESADQIIEMLQAMTEVDDLIMVL